MTFSSCYRSDYVRLTASPTSARIRERIAPFRSILGGAKIRSASGLGVVNKRAYVKRVNYEGSIVLK